MLSSGFNWTFIFQENLDFTIFSWLCSNIQSWKWWISNSNFRDVWKVVIQNLTTSYPSFHIFDKYHPFHIFDKYQGEIWIIHKHFSLVLWQFCIENYEMILDRLTFAFGLFMAEYNLNVRTWQKRQRDKKTKTGKDKNTKRQKDENTKRKKDKKAKTWKEMKRGKAEWAISCKLQVVLGLPIHYWSPLQTLQMGIVGPSTNCQYKYKCKYEYNYSFKYTPPL